MKATLAVYVIIYKIIFFETLIKFLKSTLKLITEMFDLQTLISLSVSVNEESVNKTSLKVYSQVLAFYNTFYWLLSKIPEKEFLEKNNITGTNSSFFHFDQNFRRNY